MEFLKTPFGHTVFLCSSLPQEQVFLACNVETKQECRIPTGKMTDAILDRKNNILYVSQKVYSKMKNELTQRSTDQS